MIKAISKLGIGPMSPEIIEAVYFCSEKQSEPLMLISSKNQIDWDGGYVNGWTTSQYAAYNKQLKKQYPRAQVYSCRDHCGPGFKSYDLADVYKTIDSDIENGFDLIHIDFCHYKGSREEMLLESKKALEYCLKLNPKIFIEVGTDENTGVFLEDVGRIEKDLNFFSQIAPMQFFVVQSGSLVKETRQAGQFNQDFLAKVRPLAEKYDVGIKEHNCDYVEVEELKKRRGLIDAVNVAPQYGVVQTVLTLQKCYVYGIDPGEFLEVSYQSGKWKKWLDKNTAENKYICSVIAGHYVFSSDAYKKIYEKISGFENFRLSIMEEMKKNFNIYLNSI